MKPTTTPDQPPKGSLEELFRHHLAEAEVPPRPLLWDQIDNSLLTAQNATYRRRLAATRWVAAASLLLATLAGTGWWAQRETLGTAAAPANDGIATTGRPSAPNGGAASRGPLKTSNPLADIAVAARKSGPASPSASGLATGRPASVGATAPDAASAVAPNELLGTAPAQPDRARTVSRFPTTGQTMAAIRPAAADLAAVNGTNVTPSTIAETGEADATSAARATAGAANVTGTRTRRAPVAAYGDSNGSRVATLAAAVANGTDQQPGVTPADEAAPVANALPLAEAMLAARPVVLQGPALAASRPVGLKALPVAAAGAPAHRWQFEASYAVSAFNPNVDFSRAGVSDFNYNPALGPDSPALTEAAAAEYRTNLQAGLGQRLAVRATRRLGGHWAVSTGLEALLSRASSRTSSTFVGEQVPDFIPVPVPPVFRATSFSYETAGLPLELRYDNPARRGWSAYGRLGAVVSALLRVRAEVAEVPEAGRTYTIRSTTGDYRKVLANVRGGAGVRYRPAAGNFGLTLGPTAELGLMSLNAHPAQDFARQRRPYSVGLEAGVEFGK